MVEWQQMAIYGDCSLTILRLAVITANNDSYIRPKPDVRKRPLTAKSGRLRAAPSDQMAAASLASYC